MRWEIYFPKHLLNKRLPRLNNNPVHLLGQKYAIQFFGEIGNQILRKCYLDDIVLCMRVIRQLAFYGVVFKGNLHKYSILQTETDSTYLWKDLSGEFVFNPPIPLPVLQKVKEYGILYEKDALGLPLLSLVRYQEDFPFEKVLTDQGFVFLTYSQLLDKMEKNGELDGGPDRGNAYSYRSPQNENAPKNPLLPKINVVRPENLDQILEGINELMGGHQGSGPKNLNEFRDTLKMLSNNIEISQGTEGVVTDTDGKIRINGKMLDIPKILIDKPFSSQEFPSCRQVPQKINLLGFTKWGELPFEMDELLQKITGVGPKTVKKFVVKVYEIFADALSQEAANSAIIISFGKLQVSLPKDRNNDSLTVLLDHHSSIMPILDVLDSMGVRTFADLPGNLEHLEQNLLRCQVFELFDSICHAFCIDLTLKSRLQQLIFCIVERAKKQDVKGIQRVLDILRTKYNMLEEKHNPTLKDVSKILGITRERVRQILTRFWQKELLKQNCFVDSILDDISRLGGLVPIKNFVTGLESLTPFEQFMIREVLDIIGLTIVETGPFLTTLTKRDYENIFNELEDGLKNIGEFPLQRSLIKRAVQAFVVKNDFHFTCQEAFLQIVFDEMLMPLYDGFILKNLPNSEKILCVLKEYPRGLAIRKEFDNFFVRLEQLFPGEFKKNDRYIYSSVLNSDKTYLWGWGVYIHRDNTQVGREDLREIVAWINKQFDEGVEKLSVFAAFNEFRNFMDEKGIPNEHALYSCLRHFYPESFFMPKSPYLYPQSTAENKQNTDILEEFVRNNQDNISYTKLQEEFINRLGWKEYTLNQAIALSGQIIRTARGEYGLIEFYPLATAEKLEPLVQFLETRLSERNPQINIRVVYIHKQVTCNQLKIGSDIALYSLLERFFGDRLIFSQYPHVQIKRPGSSPETTNLKQLDEYMKNFHNSIFRSELKKEFVEGRCWTEKAFGNALRANPNIFVLQYGATAEYVHADVLGWNNQKQAQLEKWVEDRLEKFMNDPVPYGNVHSELFSPQQFPQLDSGVLWTVDLLRDLIKDCSFIRFLGTMRDIFVPVPNNYGICDDVSFLAYILQKDFQGTANLSQFQKHLAEIHFSQDGEIPRAYKRGSENLPYLLTTDEIKLKELVPQKAWIVYKKKWGELIEKAGS